MHMAGENLHTENGEPLDLGDESIVQDKFEKREIYEKKRDVNPYDIFKLAKGILIVAVSIYLLFALIRIFYNDPAGYEKSGIREVWEYSKVILNSIVSLVLGLYFGSKQDGKNTKG
jgi:hypothetical protein